MIQVGQKVTFDPFVEVTGFGIKANQGNYVTGIVVFVHNRHEWFSVEYSCGGVKQRTSFKFCQIGEDVKLCG